MIALLVCCHAETASRGVPELAPDLEDRMTNLVILPPFSTATCIHTDVRSCSARKLTVESPFTGELFARGGRIQVEACTPRLPPLCFLPYFRPVLQRVWAGVETLHHRHPRFLVCNSDNSRDSCDKRGSISENAFLHPHIPLLQSLVHRQKKGKKHVLNFLWCYGVFRMHRSEMVAWMGVEDSHIFYVHNYSLWKFRWSESERFGQPTRVKRGEQRAAPGMQRRWKLGDPRENPPASDVVRHDSHVRKFGSGPHGASNPARLDGRRLGRFPAASPGFLHVGNVADVSVGWRVFSGYSRLSRLHIRNASPSETHFTRSSSLKTSLLKRRPGPLSYSHREKYFVEQNKVQRGSTRGDRDMSNNSLIASTRKALNWRAGLPATHIVAEGHYENGTLNHGFPETLTRNLVTLKEAIEMIMEQRRNERRGETGDTRENPQTNGIVRHDSHLRKSGVTRPGIEPGSPCWEASRLTALEEEKKN
ncbi:hypothetical protein PR048_000531, partial [Dryococelus australis]